jgi:hypothetical protein
MLRTYMWAKPNNQHVVIMAWWACWRHATALCSTPGGENQAIIVAKTGKNVLQTLVCFFGRLHGSNIDVLGQVCFPYLIEGAGGVLRVRSVAAAVIVIAPAVVVTVDDVNLVHDVSSDACTDVVSGAGRVVGLEGAGQHLEK